MFEVADPVAVLNEAIDGLAAASLSSLSRDDLLAVTVRFERARRRLAAVDHAIVGELDRRGICHELCEPSTKALLSRMLRLDPVEANARVAAARDLGDRVDLAGQSLPPVFVHVSEAVRAGDIGERHAAVIVRAVEDLPAEVAAIEEENVETFLVAQARDCTPAGLGRIARLLADYLDPDGTLTRDADHRRRREITLTQRRDGSGLLSGVLTPACLAAWQAVTDSLAAPRPAEDGSADPRSAAQRTHDGFEDAALRLLRSDTLPESGGVPITIIAVTTPEDLSAGAGLARTSHGGLISTAELRRLGDEAAVIDVGFATSGPVHYSRAGGAVLSYGRRRRLASPAQRYALIARDGGCSFPGCSIPPEWTQAHHIVSWTDYGPTDLENMTLVCGYHHRSFAGAGWDCRMVGGVPQWRPPAWLDPDRTPRRNTAHHPELHFRSPAEFERHPDHVA